MCSLCVFLKFINSLNYIKMNLLAIEMPDAQMQFTGWLVTIIGFTIVIVSLIILFLVFKYISKLINYDWSKPKKSKKENTVLETKSSEDIDPNIAAAIAMALYLSTEVHDYESDEVTITRIERRYSPWSSKIYGMNGLSK